MNASRRSFLGGMLAVSAALAVPDIALANIPMLYGDGKHDDSDALNALLSNKPFRTADGFSGIARTATLIGGTFALGKPLYVNTNDVLVRDCSFETLPGFSGEYVMYLNARSTVSHCHFDTRTLAPELFLSAV